jgi:TatA/E family protein of Tat protein translocase
MMFGLGPMEMVFIMVVLLLLFGAKRLPEVGQSLGRSIKEFRKAGKEITGELEETRKLLEEEE